MRKGYEVQKKSIVNHLDKYMHDSPEANSELLPLILNSIEDWDVEFQILLGESLSKAADNNLSLSPENLRVAVKVALEFIDNLNNDDVYNTWKATFPKLAH